MAVNEVIYNGETLISLKEDTVTPETLAEGATAHSADGRMITGTMKSGGSSVQSDWNQNDETAADFVKNRTHYEDITYFDVLAIPGMTAEEIYELAQSGELVGDQFLRVSDSIVAMSDFGNGFTVDCGGESYTFSAEEVPEVVMEIAPGLLMFDCFISVDETCVGVDIEGITFKKSGLYMVAYVLVEFPYISLSIPNYQFREGIIIKIDKKYLPDISPKVHTFYIDSTNEKIYNDAYYTEMTTEQQLYEYVSNNRAVFVAGSDVFALPIGVNFSGSAGVVRYFKYPTTNILQAYTAEYFTE